MPEPQSGVLATSPHPPYSRNHVPGGTRTPDPRLRRPMLYPAELLAHIGAGDGNRTHVAGLEGQNSTIELHPQHHTLLHVKKNCIGVEGFEPPAPWSQTTYSTKLSHTPATNKNYYTHNGVCCQQFFQKFFKSFSKNRKEPGQDEKLRHDTLQPNQFLNVVLHVNRCGNVFIISATVSAVRTSR